MAVVDPGRPLGLTLDIDPKERLRRLAPIPWLSFKVSCTCLRISASMRRRSNIGTAGFSSGMRVFVLLFELLAKTSV